jgi:phosphoenolpyruvate---glycerone phosphotransferase subunit DhaK
MAPRTKKLINQPETILRDMLEGFAAAYPDIVRLTESGLIVRRDAKPAGKVGLVIGNGSGHEPAMIGLVGKGLFDVNVPGEIFAAPGPDRILEGIKAADRGAGVLVCVSHHAGDLMNAEMALELCEMEGIDNVDMVVLYDDISSAPRGREAERRGTAGLFFTWKMLGAYAEQDVTLAQCKAMAEKIRDNTRTLAVAITPGTNPVSGEVMFHCRTMRLKSGWVCMARLARGGINWSLPMRPLMSCCHPFWKTCLLEQAMRCWCF